MNKTHESGQVLLITLLVLSFAAIVVLSLIARTTTTQQISTTVDDSAKALSAAEAGLELALQSHSAISDTTETGVSFQVSEPTAIANAAQYSLPEKTPKGDVAVIWLAPHTPSGGSYTLNEDPGSDYDGSFLDICWNDETGDDPAVVVTMLYKSRDGDYRVGKAAYDSVSGRSNEFSWSNASTDCPVGTLGQRLHMNQIVNPYNQNQETLLALRLRPLYVPAQFSVYTQGGRNLPAQGSKYTSTGKTQSGTTRAVSVEELYSAPGAIFDYVIYSQSGDFRQ